ncbi:MAG: hypothetical protein U0R64_09305 [Candidatus Nanopelagicales bacterium]
MATTSMKVDSAVRDRLSALAKERDMTQNSVLEFLLDEYQWAQRMRDARVAMRSASPEDLRSYRQETGDWDRVTSWPGD